MFELRHPKTGRVHFSDAKRMAVCPAKAKHAVEHPSEPTPAMVFGSLVDALVMPTGRPIRVFDGARRAGKEWEAFLADCPEVALICKREEHDRAKAAAAAVLSDPVSGPLFTGGEHQRVFEWEMFGLPWGTGVPGERGGFDVLGMGYIADLKVTQTTEPIAWSRQARRMLYVEQLAAYREAARFNGYTIDRTYLAGVEAKAPHVVTVLEVSAAELDDGLRNVQAWCERIRSCEASGVWPGYVQTAWPIEPKTAWEIAGEVDDG